LFASIFIIAASSALFLYWFRHTCLLILAQRESFEYSVKVTSTIRLNFHQIQEVLQTAPRTTALDRVHAGLEDDYRILTELLQQATGDQSIEHRVLAINYRLAPEHRFPAPLEDALAAYRWLLDQGLKPECIAFAGDSAGGNLALACLLSLRERGLPLPAAGVLMSPWTDLAATGASYTSRSDVDPIHQRPMIVALAKNYLGEDGDPCNPLVSPLYADLTGMPPLLIQVGDRETVLDDSTMFADKARAAGIDVELQVWDGMIHVFQMFGEELAEARQAIDSIAKFLDKRLPMNAEREPQ